MGEGGVIPLKIFKGGNLDDKIGLFLMIEKRKLEIEVAFDCAIVIKDEEGNPITYKIKWDTAEDLETLAFESIVESTGRGAFARAYIQQAISCANTSGRRLKTEI